MKWIRKLIEGALINGDGRIDLESLMKQINEEFPRNAVPKSEFNQAKKKLKTAMAAIEILRESKSEKEMLLEIIKQQEATIQKLQYDVVNTIKSYSLNKQFGKAGIQDPDYLSYRQRGLDGFQLENKEKPMVIEELIKSLKEELDGKGYC
ncbi:hypothetical protein R2R35_16570 [Anaerocolumna sp. AGMB13020]|uniref:phage scaffolding protein n=1 Tax=Anaerocolumna sp. AGMB13020 TaxID=3081750 RepID=UPI00295391A5|nr:hypothetical protein [Anaerocolumna sp. AGMB13020]WOO35402.1 hypothetical protein R2R35_16570 [Anaerocolumna sp. AGMB13020]